MKKLLLLAQVLCIMFTISINAQSHCGTDRQLNPKEIANEVRRMKSIEKLVKKRLKNYSPAVKGMAAAPIVTIPVVVHILYNTPGQNISDEQVLSQIEALNRDFRKLNPDAANVPDIFKPVAADCRIEFCLAQRTPAGFPTSGITRTHTFQEAFNFTQKSNFQNDSYFYGSAFYSNLGGVDAWDTTKYLNIWVANTTGMFGKSTMADQAGSAIDGIIVSYTSFGTLSDANNTNLNPNWMEGGIATHEIGHYLNLYHTFQGGSCEDGWGDYVEDTPRQSAPNEGLIALGASIDHCPNYDMPDMFMNFMDYPADPSINMFTEGQKVRILSVFTSLPDQYGNGGERVSLISSDGCTPSSKCSNPTGLKISALTPSTAVLEWETSYTALNYKVNVYYNGSWHNNIIVNAPATSLSLSGLNPNSKVEFLVMAQCPTQGSVNSSSFAFFTPLCEASILSGATEITPSSAKLTWMPMPFATSYKVELFYDGAWHEKGNTALTSFTVTGLSGLTSYNARVTCSCDTADSKPSNTISFKTPSCDAAKGLKAIKTTPTTADLSWNPVAYATTYKIELSTDAGITWFDGGSTTTNSYTATDLSEATKYSFRIASNCQTAVAAVSAPGSFTTLAYCDVDSNEPNDELPMAKLIPVTVFSGNSFTKSASVVGLICKKDEEKGAISGDQDWFYFSNKSSRNLINLLSGLPDVTVKILTVTNPTKNYIVKLYNESGIEIGSSVDGGKTVTYHPCFGATGTYYIKVFSESGFSLTDKYLITVTLEAVFYQCNSFKSTPADLSEENSVATIFPNPTSGKFTINSTEQIHSITVTDVNGKVIQENKINVKSNSCEIDLSHHAAGLYFINIKGDSGIVSKKIFKN